MAKKGFHDQGGPSQRQLRVAELIRRTLSDVLIHGHIHDPDLGRMSITVGEVRITPDLRIATAYVLPLGGHDRRAAIEALARNKGELRRAIGRATQLKHTPDLRFMIDESFDQMDEARRLFARGDVRRDLGSPEGGGDEEE